MYKIDKYNVKLTFNLKNGVYTTSCESGTGKTWLCKVLKQYRSYGEPVASYTYLDYTMGVDIASVLNSEKFKVIMLDRYDMYQGIGVELLKQIKDRAIVIVDTKSGIHGFNDDERCFIELSMNSIEVIG